jgi:hypothetical protein
MTLRFGENDVIGRPILEKCFHGSLKFDHFLLADNRKIHDPYLYLNINMTRRDYFIFQIPLLNSVQ